MKTRDPREPGTRADGYRDGAGPPSTGSEGKPYRSMKEIQAMAADFDMDEDTSLNQLTRIAEEAIQKSKSLPQRGQLDLALVQYLRASDITVNAIPRHADFSYMDQHHPQWADRYGALRTAVNAQYGVMEKIKQKISANNNMSSMRSRPGSDPISTERPQSSASSRNNHNGSQTEHPIRMPSPTSFQSPSGSPRSSSRRPGSPRDSLSRRFAELDNSGYRKSAASYDPRSAEQESSLPSDYGTPSSSRPPSQGNPASQMNPPSSRPLGPRDMYSPHTPAPTIPPKVPLMPLNSSLPRYPSPAYSPSHSVPSQTPLNPPRSSMDTTRPSYKRNPSWVGSQNGLNNGSTEYIPYRARTPNGTRDEDNQEPFPPYMPTGPTIRAEQLEECLRNLDVLLIDVRNRNEFDAGHVDTKSIMCIEPVILKVGVSAEDLEDRLVMSPEAELSLFARRGEFDLVVYYDNSTQEPSYLAGSPVATAMPHLRALYETLYEFNAYKPLKRQPALLVGGIDAWSMLSGRQGLATSHTMAIMNSRATGTAVQKPVQPLRRFPTASANSSYEVKKRRLRDYQPLDKDEERVWREKAMNEQIDPRSYGMEDQEPTEASEDEQEPGTPFVQTYEELMRRFPDPRDIRESMVVSTPPADTGHTVQDHTAPVPVRPPPAVPRRSYGGVSDGRQIQPPLARQSSATKHALYTSTSPLGRMKLPRTGLVNMGATCYMNSIIQSLSATCELTKLFLDNNFHLEVQRNWKGSQGVLPGLYANLVRSLWKNDVDIIRPTSFRKFIGRLNPDWASNQQQDAKEFFDVLIDCLHEDLNVHWNRTPTKPLTFEQEMRRERTPIHRVCQIEWERYCHRDLSRVSRLFAGQHASRLRCVTCRNTSTTYEAFFSISVEIPASGTGDIYQCLRSYCQEEMLSNDDVWKCPHCRREREATKRIILTRAPQFLVIHFKRFFASRKQQARKIHTPVNFPLNGLDMTPFMLPAAPTAQQNGDTPPPPLPQQQSEMTHDQLASSPPYLYNAYAVVRHLGSTMHEGHYISLVRDNARDCWRKFDDTRVTDFKPGNSRADNPANEQAYLVFYERVRAN